MKLSPLRIRSIACTAALGIVAACSVMTVAAPPAEAAMSCTGIQRPDPYTATYACHSSTPPTGFYRVCANDRWSSYCGGYVGYNNTASVRTEYVIVNAWVEHVGGA